MRGGAYRSNAHRRVWPGGQDPSGPQLASRRTFCSSIRSAKSASASVTSRRRSSNSSFSLKPGSPKGWVIAVPTSIRLAPTLSATDGIGVISTVGIPARSISLANVAPQRVPVPQVEVRRAAWMLLARRDAAISWPIRSASAIGIVIPVVT